MTRRTDLTIALDALDTLFERYHASGLILYAAYTTLKTLSREFRKMQDEQDALTGGMDEREALMRSLGSASVVESEASPLSAQERSAREKNLQISSLTPLERSAMNELTVCPVRTYEEKEDDLGAVSATEGDTVPCSVPTPLEVREGE